MDIRPVALVTGGSKGIGAAIATRLAADGYDLWLNYRSDDAGAAAVAARVGEAGGACTLLRYDVADREATAAALEPLLEETTPAVLVNNAGFARDTLMVMMKEEEWRGVLDVHLNGFFFTTKMVVTKMLRKRKGRVINIVSTSGQGGMAGQVNYSAAKAGLIGATKALAMEVAKRNILVNAVSPGFIATEMTAELDPARILPMVPMARMGTVEEVAGAVSFLAGPDAGYITGQVLAVNGGIYM